MQNVTAVPATVATRAADLAARMLTAHGPFWGSPVWQYVPDYARAATLRLAYAESLIGDQDRRAAAFAARPCEWCGCAIMGERRDVAGSPMHAACEREYAQDMGYLTDDFAPRTPSGMLASDLRPAPVLVPWDDDALWSADDEGRRDERGELGRAA